MKIFVDAILEEIKSGDHILVMSNGSFNGIHQTLLKRLV
jgi:UDP-N-acetylmuramate: L-alanyl-gamma-D-glutamyl-meso-diaminopimelate ligase